MKKRPRGLVLLAVATAVVAAGAAVAVGAFSAPRSDRFVVRKHVADRGGRGVVRDASLVNAWGLAASPVGPWWTANEARNTSTLYSGSGQKQQLTVSVEGGPTGIVWNATRGFVVSARGVSGPARFVYACEDGMIRGWSPVVPTGWSTESVVAVDAAAEAAVFRG